MDIKNKKVLITGGAGYIGSHVVNELLKYNYKVTVIDRYSFDKESLDTLKKNRNLEIIKGDIRDDKIIRKNIRDVDTVIHLAALVGEAACNISEKGLWAAYIRAKQWGKPRKSYKSKSKTVVRRSRKRRKGSRPRHRRRVYTRVARKAKSLLRRMKR